MLYGAYRQWDNSGPEVQDLIAVYSQLVEAARTVTSTVRQAILTAVEEEALPSLEYGAFIKRLQNQSKHGPA